MSPVFPTVSVCIPAYNEEATIESAVIQIEAAVQALGCGYEIIICDDASTDETRRVLLKMSEQNGQLRLILHEENRGIFATFEELYAAAQMDTVFLLPSDLEWPPSTIEALLPCLDRADIVIAGRVDRHYGLTRGLISRGFNLIPRILFGVKTDDAGAVKLVRREIIHNIRLISRSPFSEAERIIRAVRAGYRVESVPTVTRRRSTGSSHGVGWKIVFQASMDAIRVWWDIRIRGG